MRMDSQLCLGGRVHGCLPWETPVLGSSPPPCPAASVLWSQAVCRSAPTFPGQKHPCGHRLFTPEAWAGGARASPISSFSSHLSSLDSPRGCKSPPPAHLGLGVPRKLCDSHITSCPCLLVSSAPAPCLMHLEAEGAVAQGPPRNGPPSPALARLSPSVKQ